MVLRRWLAWLAVPMLLLAVLAGAARPAMAKAPDRANQGNRARAKGRKPPPQRGRAHAGRHADRHPERGKGKRREPEPPLRDPSLDTEPRTVADPSNPRERRIAALRQHLDDALRDKPLARTRIGIAVMDARDGDLLYAHNADKLFNPASNTKILTTAAALSELGGDYRYVTRIVGAMPDDDGVIHGSIELRGSGDPSLSLSGVAELARDLAARGVVRIEGDLLADGKYRDPDHPTDALGGGAIIMNRNVYTVHIRPTEPRKNAIVTIEPSSHEFFGAVSKVTTVPKRKTRIRLDAYRDNGRFIVVAKGRINPHDDVKLKERIGDGTAFALSILRHALADFGIELAGKTRSGTLASRAGDAAAAPVGVLAEHRSIALAEICRVSNKDSNNFVADAIFKTLGRERFGGAVTLQKGVRAVEAALTALGFAPTSYRIVNGSGLTHENRIQPSALGRLLRHLYFDLAVAPDFITSLAVGGIDGTIKGRFRGRDMVGMVRAKTGTLSNVSALSGYVGDHGDVLVFVILVDDFHHRKLEDIRDAQASMVRQMMAYLRAGRPGVQPFAEPEPPAAPPGVQDGEGDDDESDHDVDDGMSDPGMGN